MTINPMAKLHYRLSGFAFIAALVFIACGDDSGSDAHDDALPESVEQFSDIKNIECNADRECAQIYIEEHDDYVQCIDSKWETVVASKPNKACSNAKSSSSKNKSSSSKGKSSSSSKNDLSNAVNPSTVVKGTMTDKRDGKTYKTVSIGKQTWMAENLNYDYEGIEGLDSSIFCYRYNDTTDSCAKYGRLYTWAAAMDSLALFSEAGKGCGSKDKKSKESFCNPNGQVVRGVCPIGWHLPSEFEWVTLINAVGGRSSASVNLRTVTDWLDNPQGIDSYGFSVLPSGSRKVDRETFSHFGVEALFWSSMENDYDVAYAWNFLRSSVSEGRYDKKTGASVRCLKDYDVEDKSEFNASSNTLTDLRDHQTYKTVKIGDQIWMAQNLNYYYNTRNGESYCYRNDADSCAKYGRLYTWAAALDSVGVFGKRGIGGTEGNEIARGVCPNGWHVPNDRDWLLLAAYIGGTKTAGGKLKSSSVWVDESRGTDAFGFSALPAGYYDAYVGDSKFKQVGEYTAFWSSRTSGSSYAYCWTLSSSEDLRVSHYFWDYGYSVRCIKDSDYKLKIIKDDSEYDAKKNTLTDLRDNQTYRTVKIGDQVWMAQNLNYDYNVGRDESDCFNFLMDSCETYGRFYMWGAAMDAAAIFDDAGANCRYGSYACISDGKIVRGVCPKGWHLPDTLEWSKLFDYVGGRDVAGTKLKSTSGWIDGGNGTDSFGFSVIPAGSQDQYVAHVLWDNNEFGKNGYFWSSWQESARYIHYVIFSEKENAYFMYTPFENREFNVRCVMDSD